MVRGYAGRIPKLEVNTHIHIQQQQQTEILEGKRINYKKMQFH